MVRVPSSRNELCTVLVVDDDLGCAAICAEVLREAGFYVLVADNGAHALSLARQRCPDAIVTDLFLPNLPGDLFIRRLRELGIDAPVLVMSGASSGRVRAFQARAEAFLPKPFESHVLPEVVAELIGLRPHALAN